MALPIWAIYMKKVWADKNLGVSPEDKFIKPSDWQGGCGELQGMNTGYGDEGGLQTLDELKNPKASESGSSGNKKNNSDKNDNVNENLHKSDEIDFNQ
jgi:penicillin-binding protein 1A